MRSRALQEVAALIALAAAMLRVRDAGEIAGSAQRNESYGTDDYRDISLALYFD